jgi:hypothetical protein
MSTARVSGHVVMRCRGSDFPGEVRVRLDWLGMQRGRERDTQEVVGFRSEFAATDRAELAGVDGPEPVRRDDPVDDRPVGEPVVSNVQEPALRERHRKDVPRQQPDGLIGVVCLTEAGVTSSIIRTAEPMLRE